MTINLNVCKLRLREGAKGVSPKSLIFFFSNSLLLLRELPGFNLLPPPCVHSHLVTFTSSQFFLINIGIPNDSTFMMPHVIWLSPGLSWALSYSWASFVTKHTTLESCSSDTLLNAEYLSLCTQSYTFSKFSLNFTSWINTVSTWIYYSSSYLLLRLRELLLMALYI